MRHRSHRCLGLTRRRVGEEFEQIGVGAADGEGPRDLNPIIEIFPAVLFDALPSGAAFRNWIGDAVGTPSACPDARAECLISGE
jgi:hypothetical protein